MLPLFNTSVYELYNLIELGNVWDWTVAYSLIHCFSDYFLGDVSLNKGVNLTEEIT